MRIEVILAIIVVLLVALGIFLFKPNLSLAPTHEGAATTTSSTGNTAASTTLDDLIVVTAPNANDMILPPLHVTGQARGNWYFEAVFPIELQDGTGKIIAQGQGRAQGDWMTSDYVPFSATLDFPAPATATGTLILKNDNPSGDPTKQKTLSIPVRFR